MGGPSYQQPSPVKRSDGSEIIWDWNKKDFVPYDRAKADADRQRIEDHPAGSPDAYGERGPTTYTPPVVESRPPSAAASPAKKSVTLAARRGGPQPYGAGSSLLTTRGDF